MQARQSIAVPADAAAGRWTPPTGALGALIAAAGVRASAVAHTLPELRRHATDMPPATPFAGALRAPQLAVIAEIKRASPSKGDIAPGLNALRQAEAYVRGGAAAISVLTEPERFGGSLDDLRQVAGAVAIPVIRKDFIVHPVQVWEARVAGAAAVLLIARGLSPSQLTELFAEAGEAGLGVLLEVRDRGELERALVLAAPVVGVNNRNLETLDIHPGTAPALIPHIPPSVVAVAESGMATPADAQPAQQAGADALLIGSAISASGDPASAVEGFANLQRRPRKAGPELDRDGPEQ